MILPKPAIWAGWEPLALLTLLVEPTIPDM